jgi:invasion protein IalB
MFKLARIALAALAVVAAAVPALAQEVQLLGSHRDWHAFTYTENGNKVCYIATKPTREEGDYTSRGDVYLMVTHRPAESSRDVVSIITGYTYQPQSSVRTTIGDNTFTMFTSQDTAWAYDKDDRQLVAAMKAGVNMTVRGTSSRGTLTTDTYSLLGFTDAYQQIGSACGLSS